MSRIDVAPRAVLAWGAHAAEPSSTAPPGAVGGRLTRDFTGSQLADFSAAAPPRPVRGWVRVLCSEASGAGAVGLTVSAEVHGPGDDMSGASFGSPAALSATSTAANGLLVLAGPVTLPRAPAPGDVVRLRVTRTAAAGILSVYGVALE